MTISFAILPIIWLRTYLPRIFGAFESFRMLSPLPDIIEIPTGQLMPLALPQVQDTCNG